MWKERDPVGMRQEAAARAFDVSATRTLAQPDRHAAVASDLAVLVAHEVARADAERRRRQEVEMTASQLAVLVAHEHAELAHERSARERAEAEADELRRLVFAEG